jgi:MinD-like ATPase involved in chromosome partitioning or flagellar assembly
MPKIVSIHSFRPGAGKSTLTANLAVIIASQDYRVAILDTDFQSLGVHLLFGLDESKLKGTFNDYLYGQHTIAEIAHDVSDRLKDTQADNGTLFPAQTGSLYLIPSSFKTGEIARWLYGGFDLNFLFDGFSELVNQLNLDYLLIDAPAGFNEESLFSFAIADMLLLMLSPDLQNFQGTAVTVEVARKLAIPKIFLVLNEVLPAFDLDALRQKVESVYKEPVAGILPMSEELVLLASRNIFCLHSPNHPFSQELKVIAQQIIRSGSKAKTITQELFLQLRAESLKLIENAGLSIADILILPDSLRQLVNWIMRYQEVTILEVATHIDEEEDAAYTMLESLVAQGFLSKRNLRGKSRYRLRLAPKRKRNLPQKIWQVLEENSVHKQDY